MTSLSNEEAFAELYYAKKAIKDVLGVTVQCWRPPYGDVDGTSIIFSLSSFLA
jgi:hypothetical protein